MPGYGQQADMTGRYRTPGVYFEKVRPARILPFQTGRPVFIGFVEPAKQDSEAPERLDRVQYLDHFSPGQFARQLGRPISGSFLAPAIVGFFANGGDGCYVVPLPLDREPDELLAQALAPGGAVDEVEEADLVCVPDLMGERFRANVPALQRLILDHCQRKGDRFAILDAAPPDPAHGESARTPVDALMGQRRGLNSDFGALYYPWLRIDLAGRRDGTAENSSGEKAQAVWVPPCGHVAGVYARTDRDFGPHKAPANALVEGVIDLEAAVTDREQARLNEAGINCLRYFAGRGIRVWGARTLSVRTEYRYINVRRLTLSLIRWIEYNFRDFVFEPNEPSLWERIRTRLTGFCQALYRQGALQGRDRDEAFFIKCDAETNPPEMRETGCVVAYLGVAALAPAEFVILRITQSVADGIRVTEPNALESM